MCAYVRVFLFISIIPTVQNPGKAPEPLCLHSQLALPKPFPKRTCANKKAVFSAHLTQTVSPDSIIPNRVQVTRLNEDTAERESSPEEAGFTHPPLTEESAFVFAVTRRHCAPRRRAFCLPFLPSETMCCHNVPQSWN